MFNNVKRLSDQQLDQVIQKARSGDNEVLQAMGLYSPIPLLAEKMRRNNLRQAQAAEQAQQQEEQTVADQIAGVGSLPVPGMMEERNFAGGGIVTFQAGGAGVPMSYEEFDRRTVMAESSGNPYAVGPMTKYGTAKGDRQVLDMTNRDPGFGVTPARDDSLAERSRVGKDYLTAMIARYKNFPYASLAYNWGPGNVDNWIRRGANPREIPADARAYVIKTSGFDFWKLNPDGTAKFTAKKEDAAPGGMNTPPTDKEAGAPQMNYKTEMAGLDAERKNRLAKVEADYNEAIKLLGPVPKPSDKEAIRKKALEEAAAINEPYLKEMNALMEAGKPDPNAALLKASLALMGGRGKGISGALADIGAAGGVGLDAFEKSKAAHQRAQELGLKAKFELAKGDKKYADELADAAVREDRNAVNLYKSGMQTAMQARRYGEMSVDQAMDARYSAMKAAEEARLRELGLDRREAARLAAENTRYQREEDRNKRTLVSQLHRSIDSFTKSKEMEPLIEAERGTPDYQVIKKSKGVSAADAWAAEQARNKAIDSTLAAHGITREEYMRFSRGLGGLPAALSPAASSAPSIGAAPGDYSYNQETGRAERIK